MDTTRETYYAQMDTVYGMTCPFTSVL